MDDVCRVFAKKLIFLWSLLKRTKFLVELYKNVRKKVFRLLFFPKNLKIKAFFLKFNNPIKKNDKRAKIEIKMVNARVFFTCARLTLYGPSSTLGLTKSLNFRVFSLVIFVKNTHFKQFFEGIKVSIIRNSFTITLGEIYEQFQVNNKKKKNYNKYSHL